MFEATLVFGRFNVRVPGPLSVLVRVYRGRFVTVIEFLIEKYCVLDTLTSLAVALKLVVFWCSGEGLLF